MMPTNWIFQLPFLSMEIQHRPQRYCRGNEDRGRAKIVGTKTFGKGIVQTLLSLQDGSAVKITTQHYYTPSGFDLHKKGIEPDVVVELNKETKTKVDNQLQEAIKALN